MHKPWQNFCTNSAHQYSIIYDIKEINNFSVRICFFLALRYCNLTTTCIPQYKNEWYWPNKHQVNLKDRVVVVCPTYPLFHSFNLLFIQSKCCSCSYQWTWSAIHWYSQLYMPNIYTIFTSLLRESFIIQLRQNT